MVTGSPTNDLSHGGINREPFRVIGVFVASQPTKDRLAQQRHQRVLCVLPCAPIIQQSAAPYSQLQCLIQFSVHQQSRIGGDVRPMKFQLQPTIKTNSQTLFFACTIGFSVFFTAIARKPFVYGLNYISLLWLVKLIREM